MNEQKEEAGRFVVQPNQVSRSLYKLSLTAKRLVSMAMSYLGQDIEKARQNDFVVNFSVSEFMDALKIERGDKTRQLIKNAIAEAMEAKLEIWITQGYFSCNWFSWTFLHTALGREIAWGMDKISLKFNPDFLQAIGFESNFQFLMLNDLSKFQSIYSYRLFEVAMSWIGKEGKDGNPPGKWWFSYTLEELKALFKIDHGKYKANKDFRVKVIDNPISEINSKNVGIRIKPEYRKRGRYLHAVIFHCKKVDRDEPLPVTPVTETDKENDQLREAFPEDFEKYKTEELTSLMQQPYLPGFIADNPSIREAVAEERTFERLREAHPDFLKTNRAVASRRKK